VLPALKAVLDRAVPFPPELMIARFAQNGPLVGAAALAWDAVTAGRGPATRRGGDRSPGYSAGASRLASSSFRSWPSPGRSGGTM
jgi:hypothetical protein